MSFKHEWEVQSLLYKMKPCLTLQYPRQLKRRSLIYRLKYFELSKIYSEGMDKQEPSQNNWYFPDSSSLETR